ncbi:MAG: hypothetical protein Q4G63_04565 [Bacteroidia bacterium]|nr:hypothetical protein [Bacteroidia bacterium]
MDIQTRKIKVVQEFLTIENEETVSRFERLLRKERNSKFKPMGLLELSQRIDQSMEDSKNNKLTEVDDLISEIEQWR